MKDWSKITKGKYQPTTLNHLPVSFRTTNSFWRAACALNNRVWNHLRLTRARCSNLRVRAKSIASLSTLITQLRLLISTRCPTSIRKWLRINQRLRPRTWDRHIVPINLKIWSQRLDTLWRAISDIALPSRNRLYQTCRSPAWETDFPKLQTFTRPIWSCIIDSQIRRALFLQCLN